MGRPQTQMTPAQRARLARAVERRERENGRVAELIVKFVVDEDVAAAAIARELGVSRQAVYATLRRRGIEA